jgi:hypothetical protein
MILKEREIVWRKKAKMELDILLSCSLTTEHRKQVEEEKWRLHSGDQGETDTAYDLNLRYRESKNLAVLHDLRLVDGDDVAQIDHLLIFRTMDFFVLETKNYSGGVRILPSGEFEAFRKDGSRYPIPSPIAQNDRHIVLLQRLLDRHGILPKRMGLAKPRFHNYVLVSPRGRIDRPKQGGFSQVVKSDLFFERIQEFIDRESPIVEAMKRLASIVSQESLRAIGTAIASWHKTPPYPDYRKRWGITDAEIHGNQSTEVSPASSAAAPPSAIQPAKQTEYFCFRCRRPISAAEAHFCFNNKTRFGGKAYCREHQKNFR